jgi:uncharacterized phage protein gp47/JayE
MAISTKTFTDIVSDAVAAIQGASSQLIDMTVGSVLRAVTEASAAIALWIQGLALQIAALTRFATSTGADADSWAADYGFIRLPATPATGPVTFARFTPTALATVPVGSIVQTADGSQKYSVIADTAQAAYSSSLNAYVLSAGVSSITATVQSISLSSAANAAAGIINTLGNSLAGVDTVMNAAGLTNGSDLESDANFKIRFVSYINNLSRATVSAIGNAITSLQQGVTYTLTEGFTYAGAAQLGFFYVVVDDGTGTPSAPFLATVSNAVDAVRPVGSTFSVFAPVVVTANVAMVITTGSGYTHSVIVASVVTALQAFINTLPIGATLPYSRLAQIAYTTSAGVTNVTGVTLNSSTSDLTATAKQIIKTGTISVT